MKYTEKNNNISVVSFNYPKWFESSFIESNIVPANLLINIHVFI